MVLVMQVVLLGVSTEMRVAYPSEAYVTEVCVFKLLTVEVTGGQVAEQTTSRQLLG